MTRHDYNNIIMNALECRTLTATCMHDSCACIALLTVYACSISRILNYIATLHLNMFMVLFKSVHDPGVGEGLLSVLKARYQLETTAEIGILQRLVLPLNKRIEASSWCLNERLT